MPGIAEELQFVAMKTVAAIGGDMHRSGSEGYAEDGKKARADRGVWSTPSLIVEGPGHT
jgi:hypothetical protein